MKKIISLLLCALMLLCVVPTGVFAEGEEPEDAVEPETVEFPAAEESDDPAEIAASADEPETVEPLEPIDLPEVLEPTESAEINARNDLSDGYYLIGKLKGVENWTVDGIDAANKLHVNPANADEYCISFDFSSNDQFKVVYVQNGEISLWSEKAEYSDGSVQTGNFYIGDSGNYTGLTDVYYNVGERKIYVKPLEGTYLITYIQPEHGSVSGPVRAAADETVTIHVTADEGYRYCALELKCGSNSKSFYSPVTSFERPSTWNGDIKVSVTILPIVPDLLQEYSLNLSDLIGVQFFFDIPEQYRVDSTSVAFEFRGTLGARIPWNQLEHYEGDVYRYTYKVTILEMAEVIKPHLYYVYNGVEQDVTKARSATWTYWDNGGYSVGDYMEAALAGYEKLAPYKPLCRAMARLGYWATKYLASVNSFNESDYASLDNENRYYATHEILSWHSIGLDTSKQYSQGYEIVKTIDAASTHDASDIGFSLDMKSRTILYLYFKFQPQSVTLNGTAKSLKAVNKDGYTYRVATDPIKFTEMKDVFTFTVVDDAGKTITVEVSPMSYVWALLKDVTNENLVDPMQAFAFSLCDVIENAYQFRNQ